MAPGRRGGGGGGGGGGRGGGGRGRGFSGRGSGRSAVRSRDGDQDDVDRFHAGKSKLSLRLEDDAAEEEREEDLSGDEAGVFDLGGSSEDEEGEEDEEEEADSEEEAAAGGSMGRMAKAERALRSRMALQRGEDDGEEEEEEAPRGAKGWGKRKQAYYDDGEDESDEDAEADEEKEALRLQREAAAALRADDFDQDEDAGGMESGSDGDDEEDEEDEAVAAAPTLGAAARAAAAAAARGGGRRGAPVVEALPRSGAGLSGAAAAAAVARDAPELAALAAELRGALDEVRSRAAPLTAAVRAGELASAEGLSYLEAKHLLLLSYCVNIAFYVLLKAEGRSVKDHPVVLRLVEARAFLEKARPIDKKLAYQLDKLLRLAAATDAEADGADGDDAALADEDGDALAHRPRPDMLLPAAGAPGARGGRDGVYRPPKIAPAAMAGDEGPGAAANKAARGQAERRRRAAQSSLVQELAEELEGAPHEVRAAAGMGAESAFVAREAARLARRAAEEEDLFVRVPLSKQERARAAAAGRKAVGMSAQVGDFGDDVGDIVDAVAQLEAARRGGDAAPAPKRVKLSAIAAAAAVSAHNARAAQAPASGEQDVPMRAELGARRSAFERRAGARDARAAAFGEGDDGNDAGGEPISDDERYTAAAEAAATRRAAKRAAYGPERFAPVFPEAEAELDADEDGFAAKRGITGAMASNRGLTPHRNKEMKNPRKKHRIKFEKALVRRRGAVRDVKPGSAGGYGGEATGIKATVARSRKL